MDVASRDSGGVHNYTTIQMGLQSRLVCADVRKCHSASKSSISSTSRSAASTSPTPSNEGPPHYQDVHSPLSHLHGRRLGMYESINHWRRAPAEMTAINAHFSTPFGILKAAHDDPTRHIWPTRLSLGTRNWSWDTDRVGGGYRPQPSGSSGPSWSQRPDSVFPQHSSHPA